MREDEFDPDKHITFPELQHIIRQGESPPKDKALVLFTYFKAHLHLSQDDLILKTQPTNTPMTKEQAQNLKIGDKTKLAEPLTVIDPKGVKEKILAQTQEGHLVFVEPHETQLAEPAPKYDPCRPFKSGDIVEVDTHGRDISESLKKAGVAQGERYTVTEDENNTGYVPFIGADGIEHHAMFFWLKLVQPVEEMGPYMVKELKDSFIVYHDCTKIVLNDTSLLAKFMKASHPNAKAAAQAECDRLNALYRKEQE